MKPNIFDISTKELSQDAFITWLLQWADGNNANYDQDLNKCGIDFVTELIKKGFSNFNEKITTVRAGRQWEYIDVWAQVNDKYLIIIEDKTNAKDWGNVITYKATAEKWCKEQIPKYENPICIYLKTGNEAQKSLNQVVSNGFKLYNRQNFLSLLKDHKIENDIFNDFKSRLARIERSHQEWENKPIKDWAGNDWQGFFQFLETDLNIIDWGYKNNRNGGFWYAVLNWDGWDIYPVFLHIEQDKLCFKISTDPDDVDLPEDINRGEIRNEIHELIINSAKNKGITTIKRPGKFGNGKYMTFAIVDAESWLGKGEERIDKQKVLNNLSFYKNFLAEAVK